MIVKDILAVATLIFWPIIPLFWIPVHSAGLFRRLGVLAYGLPILAWGVVSILIYDNRAHLLKSQADLPLLLSSLGWLLLAAGTMLHLWTAKLLGGLGIIGVPEIFSGVRSHLVQKGPFSVVRHPTYLAHTLMFTGAFLITGVWSVGVVAALDFAVVNAIIIPIEERELSNRFGAEYESYERRVCGRFFPRTCRRSDGH